MIQLDIQQINRNAPYLVRNSKKENYFDFASESEVRYSVGFDPDDLMIHNGL